MGRNCVVGMSSSDDEETRRWDRPFRLPTDADCKHHWTIGVLKQLKIQDDFHSPSYDTVALHIKKLCRGWRSMLDVNVPIPGQLM